MRSLQKRNLQQYHYTKLSYEEELNLKYEIRKFKESVNEKGKEKTNKKKEKALTFYNARRLPKGSKKLLMILKSKILPIKKQTYRKGIKIITPKQMFQSLPTALAKVKANNTSKNLLNVI